MAEKFIQILEVYNEAGVRGFWNGVIPTLIMVRDDWLLNLSRVITDPSTICLKVSNPSMQFMLYETMLKKLKKQRALSKKGDNVITALEVCFCFFSSGTLLLSILKSPIQIFSWHCRPFDFLLILMVKAIALILLDISSWSISKAWSYRHNISSSCCKGA